MSATVTQRPKRLIVIEASGNNDLDYETKQAIKIHYTTKGYNSMKEYVLALILRDEPDLRPWIEAQLGERYKRRD